VRILLAGHLDTVPPNDNAAARLQGDELWGLGAADMKGGLAVMLRLAAECATSPNEFTFVFYAREEVASAHSGLLELERERPDLLAADVAILGEPTNATVEAGCQGSIRGELTIRGHRAHTARAWMGVNAVHRAAPILAALAAYEPRRPTVEGCEFHEALLAVAIEGGVAGNVVPDEVTITVAARFAPDRSLLEAEHWVSEWVQPFLHPGDTWRITERAPAAYPAIAHPVVAYLRERWELPVSAKLGWTDAAFFAARGVPAINFGPGDPVIAHTASERVTGASLARAYEVLADLVVHQFVPTVADA
jgi:succinyl-diaminopimelate desuccinylase